VDRNADPTSGQQPDSSKKQVDSIQADLRTIAPATVPISPIIFAGVTFASSTEDLTANEQRPVSALNEFMGRPGPPANVEDATGFAFVAKLTPIESLAVSESSPALAAEAPPVQATSGIIRDGISAVPPKQFSFTPASTDPAPEASTPAVKPLNDPKADDFSDAPKHRSEASSHASSTPPVSVTEGPPRFEIQAPPGGAPVTTVAAKAVAPGPTVAESLRAADSLTEATVTTPATGAVRSIALQVAPGDSAPVELHVSERAGEIHIAVRTPDRSLETALRQDLGALSNSLERAGYRTETLVPDAGLRSDGGDQTLRFAHADFRQGHDSQAGFSGRGSGESHQQRERRRRDARSAKWIEELENLK
jgi:hypothetical protein